MVCLSQNVNDYWDKYNADYNYNHDKDKERELKMAYKKAILTGNHSAFHKEHERIIDFYYDKHYKEIQDRIFHKEMVSLGIEKETVKYDSIFVYASVFIASTCVLKLLDYV